MYRGGPLRVAGMAVCAIAAWLWTGAAPAGQAGRRAPQFDQDAVDRGAQILVRHCAFCHGSNARGAAGGPDLLRSPMVMEDENGKEIGEFLKVGRPDKGMPKVDLTAEEVSDLATFLHAGIAAAANPWAFKNPKILPADVNTGE